MRSTFLLTVVLASLAVGAAPDWPRVNVEILRHFQAIVRMDTSDPPGNEAPAVEYLKQFLRSEGISFQVFAKQSNRPNLVARLRGNGAARPVLIMGHTDVVNVDPSKWKAHGPFSADRDGGYIYGRGTIDDKPDVVAGLMTLILLKRSGAPLDRDVVFLAEAGEEGSTDLGIEYMVSDHWPEIDAEYCLAEGGEVMRRGGRVISMNIMSTEKVPVRVRLRAVGTAGHGSAPLVDNAIARVAGAVARAAAWQTPLKLNDTTRTYFERLATISAPENGARYRALTDPARAAASQAYLREHEPSHYSMLRTSISPTIFRSGYRVNVIPAEAEATLDIRAVPNEDLASFYAELKRQIADDSVEIIPLAENPLIAPPSRLDTPMFRLLENLQKQIYPGAVTLPSMLTGATDMAQLRARGMQCYGIGPLIDAEDKQAGYADHSDQERILEEELYRYVRFEYEAVAAIATRH